MKEHLLYLLLATVTASTAYGQDACDNTPVQCSSCPVYKEGGGPVNLLNGTGLELSDADSESGVFISLQAATVELQTDTADAANVTLTVNTTICEKYYLNCTEVSGRTALNITGNQSLCTYQKVLLQVKFDITADEPDLMERHVTLRVYDGLFWSDPAIIVVAVNGINDNPPMITVTPAGLPFVEGNSLGVGVVSSVNISDRDSGNDTIVEARVTILNPQDDAHERLSTYNLHTYGLNITNGSTLMVTGNASSLTYSIVLQSIRYFNDAEEPDVTPRIIEFFIDDGKFNSSADVTIDILPLNDNRPMINVSSLPDFTEGGGPLYLFNNTLDLYDLDSINSVVYIQSFTVNLTDGAHNESLMASISIIGVEMNGNNLVFRGNHTLEEYQIVAQSVVYINTDDELVCPLNRTIQLTIIQLTTEDKQVTTNLTVSLSLVPYNDKPPVVTPQYNSVNFTEGSVSGVAVFPIYNITDEDEVCGENTLQSVEVTLYPVDRGEESISIAFCNDSDISSGSGYEIDHCDPVDLENITMTMGDMIPINITRQLVDCNIILTITGEASLEIYQDLIQLIYYNNTADEPELVNRNVSLLVNDGANVSTAYTNIMIIPVPDSPPVLNPNGDPIMTENMGPISVIYNITDDDQLSQHQLISQINISIDNPSTNEDILLVNGTMLNDTFVPIDCTDCDSLECCVDRVQVVMYNNTADEPSYPLWRSFTIQIEAVGVPLNYSLYNVNVSIDLVNDYPPVLQVNGSAPADETFITEFIEDSGPVLIFDNPIINDTDVGSDSITLVTIEVDDKGNMSNIMYDWFSYNNTTNLDINNASGLLEISGTNTTQEYMRLLSTVSYVNTLEEPNLMYQERYITVTIREHNQSYTANIIVELIAVNDPAQFNFLNKTVTFDEATRDPVRLFKPNDVIVDPDQDYLSYVTLTLWPEHDRDELSISDMNTGPPFISNMNRTHINISGVADITEYQVILQTATFVNTRVDSPPSTRRVIVNIFDGQNNSNGSEIHININATDDPPLCFFGGNIDQSTFETVLRCDGKTVCRMNLCSEEAPCFNITDFDSDNGTFPVDAIATVIIEGVKDIDIINRTVVTNEKIVFSVNSKIVELPVPIEPPFVVEYHIFNISTYSELTELLQYAVYNNMDTTPTLGIRTIAISLSINVSQQCLIRLDVGTVGRLRTVLPSSLQINPVLNYTEDSGPVLLIPEDLQSEFFFNFSGDSLYNTGFSVILNILNGSNNDPGQLILPNGFSAVNVTIRGENSSRVTVEYSRMFSNYVPLESFDAVFRNVSILFNDQAPRRCIHEPPYENCTALEIVNRDYLEGTDHVTRLYVTIEAVNDQPVLKGLRNGFEVLDNYLPPEINNGFGISFLITENEVTDEDRAPYNPDIIGLAVVNVTHGAVDSPSGVWQYRNSSDVEWINIMNVSDCYPIFIYPEGFIRFHPIVNPAGSDTDSNVTLTIRAWDGTSKDTVCTSGITNHTLPVSANTETFTYQLVYLNRAPIITVHEYNISTDEDVASDAINVSAIVMELGAVDPEDTDTGLGVAVIFVNNSIGYWQYQVESIGDWMRIPNNATTHNAFLLYPNDSVRFSPNNDSHGSSYITVLAAEVENIVPLRDRIVNTTSDNMYTSSYSINSSNIIVTVISVLDPPVLECPTTVVVYHENSAPVYIFEGLTITSVETKYLKSATVKLLTEEDSIDMLHYPNDSGFNISMDNPHCITISNKSSINAFQHFLRQISFSIDNDTEIEPSVQMRTVFLTVNDSLGSISSKSVEVNITLVNDQPPRISLPEDNVTFIEDSGPLQLFPTAPSITDPDDNRYQSSVIQSAYLYLDYHDTDFERLSFNSSSLNNDIVGSFNGSYLYLRGNATIEDYEEAFTRIYYHNNMSEPDPSAMPRVLNISICDGMFYEYCYATLTIDIVLVNDQSPTIWLSGATLNNTVNFNEGSEPVFIAPQAMITDEDSDSSTSISYFLNASIVNSVDDEIIFRNNSANASTAISIGGRTSLEYVQQVLREIQYINNAREPTGSYRLLRVDIFDTYDEPDGAFIDTAYVRVDFNFIDDLPQFSFNITAILYEEGDGAVQVAPGLTIVDEDDDNISLAIIELTSVNVTLNFAVEIITIDEELLYGTNISLNESNGTLSLTGIDCIETYEEILRSLTYNYTIAMGDPMEGKRILQGYVEGVRINTTSEVDTLAICFTSVDNPPIIDLNGPIPGDGQTNTTVFEEEGDPVAIASNVALIEDVDSAVLQYINFTLINPRDGDEEGIMLGSSYSHHIHYSMEGSPSTYTEILRNVTYLNTADEPDPEPRIIHIIASDGSMYSTRVQSIVNILLTDDIPELYLDGDSGSVNYSTTFTENDGPVNLTLGPIVNDSDAVNVTELVISLSPAEGVVTASVPLYRVDGNWLYNETTTIERITAIISSLVYEDEADEPLPGDRLICLSVTIDGAMSNMACTEVLFVPVDDNLVRFTMNYSGAVPENDPGVNVTRVIAEDNDSFNSEVNITYDILGITGIPYDQGCPVVGSGSATDNGTMTVDAYPFIINQTSGWISTTDSPPDRETYSSYFVVVEATEGDSRDIAHVSITVDDVNDNCPTFYPTMYSVTIPQGAEANSPLVNLSACDPDGDRIDVGISDPGITVTPAPSVSLFGIDGLTLTLLVDEDVLIERNQSTYDVVVCIKSTVLVNGGIALCTLIVETATVHVNVLLNNHTPQFTEDSYNASVPENTITTSFLRVVALDGDTGSNADISYNIINNMSSLPFAINDTTGYISVVQSLNFEERNYYSFLVSATDQGFYPRSSTALIEVYVENVNDVPPVFNQSEYTASVQENVSVPYDIIQVQAYDIDGATITYELTSLDPAIAGLFEIDSTTGIISVVNSMLLDHERFGTINFTVTANDTLNTAEAAIFVTVIDIDEPPYFNMSVYNVVINETFTPNTYSNEGSGYTSGLGEFLQVNEESKIVQVTAIDPDGSDVTYSFPSPQDYFAINMTSGVITSHALLDREVIETFSIPVLATDSTGNTGSATVEIRVLDINDNRPTFIPQVYSEVIPENYDIESIVSQVTVCDLDESSDTDAIQLTITNADVPFNLTTPIMISNDCYVSNVILTSSLDYEMTRMYSLTIVAADTGTPSLNGTGTVFITVSDVNDNPPVINIMYIVNSLSEAAQVGSFIANYTVTDEDTGVNAEYIIITSNSVTATNGTISLAQQLDFEEATELYFTLTVMGTPLPTFEDTVNVTIAVENVNDVPAMLTFARQQTTFYEGSTIIRLDPGISISDIDSEVFHSGTVRISVSPSEPHFSFAPNNNSLPYNCPLEDKFVKFRRCGFTDAVLLTDSDSTGITLHNGAMLNDTTLYLNASNSQYMIYSRETERFRITSGASILFWVRKNHVSTSSVQPLLAKGNVFDSRNIFSVSCLENNDLQFSYYNSTNHQQNIVLNYNCTDLEDTWHHMGIVLNPNNNFWTITLHVDGIVVDSQDISAPSDDMGQFFVGTDINKQSFFNGSVHFVIFSTVPANNKNDINCAIGCGVTLQSLTDTPLYYRYSYDDSTLYILGMGNESVYEDFFNSLYFISAFSELYSDRYVLNFDLGEVSPNEIDYAVKTMQFLFEIELIYINQGTPELLLDGNVSPNYHTSFTEEGPPVSLVNVNLFSLTDSDLNPSNYTVTVTIMDSVQGDKERVYVDGKFPLLQINDSDPHNLVISGNTNIMNVEDALRRVVYINTAEELNGIYRIVGFVVDDNYRNQPLRSDPATTHIMFISVNDPPEIAIQPLFVYYSEGGDVLGLVENISITDNDGSFITMAVISLTAFDEAEEIDIDTNGTDIVAEHRSNYSVIELTGSATHSDYQQVLTSLTYHHSSEDTMRGTRIVSIRISDGDKYSEQVDIMIFFESINDAPVLDPNGPEAGFKFVTEFEEDMNVAVSVLSNNFTLLDPDNSSLAYISLHLVNALDGDQEFLRVNFADSQTILIDPNNINSSYIMAFEEVLATAEYVNTAEEPTAGNRNITFTVSDGIDHSVSYTCIQVIARNDTPLLDLNGNDTEGFDYYTTFIDSGGAIPITNNVIIEDNDEDSVIEYFMIYFRNPPVDGGMEVISFDPQGHSFGCSKMAYFVRCNVTDLSTDQVIDILNSVSYNNTSDEPSTETRVVDFTVSDGIEYSNTASVFISIRLVNEYSPQFISANYSVNIEENQPVGTEVNIANFRASDNDSGRDGEISYSIDSGNDLEHFFINTSTGMIYTGVMLDRENISSYQLLVVATDNGTRNGTAVVQITVLDENDNFPQFAEDTIYNHSVSEFANISEIIYSISATDADGDLVMFLFEGGQDIIGVTGDGNITVVNSLDADNGTTVPVYTIDVTISDMPGKTTIATFTVTVIDENEHPPRFAFAVYTISVSEGISVRERIGEEITAIDDDVTSNLTYSTNSSTFVIAYGEFLTVATSLDRETEDQYFLTLTVSDGLYVATTSVNVYVTDINDNAPVFDRPPYYFTVSEKTANFSEFVTASDEDLGRNSQINYFIFDSVNDVIQINNVTGEITLSNPLDFETMPSIVFTVYAVDGGIPSLNSSVVVNITVDDINEEVPNFTQAVYTTSVEEGITNITVTNIVLTNPDDAFVFALEEDFGVFVIDPVTGEITAITSLDYETNCTYRLTVIATNLECQDDSGLLQSTAIVEVLVINIHDVPPMFNQSMYAVSIYENEDAGSLVTVVYATDEDSFVQPCTVLLEGSGSGGYGLSVLNSELQYFLNSHTDLFMINSHTGEITTKVPLDREKNARYALPVTVIDAVNALDMTIVNVIVLDRNDNRPRFTSESYSMTVEENTPVGSMVLQVIAEDQDMLDNGTLRYSLPDDITGFNISSITGIVSTSELIDFDYGPTQYSFNVIVHDSASQNGTALVTIEILDVNDISPVLTNVTASATFSELLTSLQTLSTIVISDEDSFQTISSAEVKLVVPNTAVAISGECRCSDTQDSSTCGPAGCNEFLQLGYDFPGMVTLLRLNDSVILLSLNGTYNISTYTTTLRSIEYINIISHPSAEPRRLYVTANDGIFDSNTVVQSIIVEPFNVFAPVLDLNGINMNGSNFSTSFIESGNPVAMVDVDVVILDDDNDSSLDVITSAVIEIVNPLDGGMEYLTSSQMQPGVTINGDMSHRIVLTGEGSYSEYYQILLGLRYTNQMPEPFLSPRQIRFTLHQYQHTSEPVYTTVNIVAVNNHGPIIFLGGDNLQNYQTEFPEGSMGVPIASSLVRIIDMDSGDDVIESLMIVSLIPFISSDRIFISNMSQFPTTITINNATGSGRLTLNGPASIADFTAAIKLVYYQNTDEEFQIGNPLTKFLSIIVSDSSLSSIPSLVNIVLIPVNDQQPVFGLDVLEINVSESSPVDSVITVLTAVDGDTLIQPTTVYTILNESSPFYVNETTGELTNNQTLDSETFPRPYVLAVQARDAEYNDNGSHPDVLTLLIFLEDENDNDPIFPEPLYNVSVMENVTNGTSVIIITATDDDVDESNELIVYEILNTTDFVIDSNGSIKTNTMLDRERQDYYELTIIARHPSNFNSSGTTILNISIVDVDDNDPVLMLIPDSGVLVEPATIVSLSDMLTVMDNDVNPTLSYATVQVLLSNGNTLALGQLLSLHNTSSISFEGNNSQMLQYTGEASIQDYEELLRSVVYQDNAAEPVPATRLVEFVVASQRNTSTSIFSLSVTVINDNPPYLTLDSTNSSSHQGDLGDVVVEGSYFTTFVEEGDPVSITSQHLEIIDIDSGFNNLSYAVVCIKDNMDVEVLKVTLTDNIRLSANSNNTWLNLTGPASFEEYEDALRSISYVNLANEPTGETREVSFYVNDGLFNSNMPSAYITIIRVNDAPVVTLGLNATVDVTLMYLENQSQPLLLAQNIRINDAENDPISYVNIEIDDRLSEEILTISADVSGFLIQDTRNGLVLVFPGGASGTEFERVTHTLRYENSRISGPVQSPRMISFIAVDEVGATSMQAFAIINFESIDNPPMIDLNGNLIAGMNFSTVFTEESSAILIVNSQATITDIDSEDLYLMVISFKNIPDLTYEDLVIQNTGVMVVERRRDNSSLCINITGQRPISDYLSVLMSIHYINRADEPLAGQREISIQVYSRSTNGNLTASNTAYSLISIAHINDHSPVFTRDVYSGFVLENTTGTQVIVTVSATDNDKYGNMNITYMLSHDVIDFLIDPVTGVITTNDTVFDREAEDYINFTVWAIDNDIDTMTGTATVNITVLDVNDNCPMFNRSMFVNPIVIPENLTIGSIIAYVTATDIDAGTNGQIRYQVSTRSSMSGSGSGANNIEPFDVITENGIAILSLVTTLDHETVSEYTIIVEATDGNCTNTIDISVNVSDVNDNPPVFTNLPANLTLSEAIPIDEAEIYQITAEDADLNAVIQFSLLTFTDIFTINPTTGAISLSNTLDYEQTQEYILNIQASDSILTSQDTLFITVSNVNDNPPVFTNLPANLTLSEAIPIDEAEIYQVTAEDADLNAVIQFSLLTFADIFTINPTTGAVTLNKSLDYEQTQEYILNVQASDSIMTSQGTLFITVSNVNDNPPVFTNLPANLTLSEATPIDEAEIYQVTAEDADLNAVIQFSLLTFTDIFTINRTTGVISSSNTLDYEQTQEYILNIQASDSIMTSEGTLHITVLDVNDEPPVLTITTPQVTYTENSNEILVAADIEIVDIDGPLHPLMGATITLDAGECRLSSNELQEACPQSQSTCASYCAERLTFDRNLLSMYSLTEQSTSTDHAVFITGNASESSYQEILRSFAYINDANEPYAGDRIVSFQVTDDRDETDRIGESNIEHITVRVELIDEYCPIVSSVLDTATFVEGSNLTYVGQNVTFTITDRDREPHKMLSMLEVRLRNVQAEEYISVANGNLLITPPHINGSDLVIRVQGTATVELYRQTLQSLTYSNTQDEPTLDERLIIILPIVVGGLPCTAHNVSISVTPVNDNPPNLTVETQAIEYTEESGLLLFAQLAGLHLTDRDHNEIFNMVSAEVLLTNVQDGNSEIIEFSTTLPNGTDLIQENHRISMNYTASVSAYNSLLNSLTYRNDNPEPTPGMRTIEVWVNDGVHYTHATLFVVVVSINDNDVILEAGSSVVVLSEGTTEAIVGLEAMLVLMDHDGEISSLWITLSNRLDQLEEIRIVNSSSINSSANETSIYINGIMPVSTYQNILNGLVYSYPQAIMEPMAGNRTITISASDDTSTSTLSITLMVELVNNHNPTVDLNGPTMNGLNYSTSINFSYAVPNKVSIVSPDVTISDGDTDAFINKLEIRLNEESEDSLIVNLPNCSFPQGVAQISCQIMTDPQFACVCGNSLMASQDLRTLEVNLTQKAIVVIQPQNLVSFEIFQDLLTLVWLQHSPAPPSGSYISTVSIVVFDGQLYSEPAFTTVAVQLLPAIPAPILEEGGITNGSIVVKDGTISIPIAMNAIIVDSNSMLQGMIVTLTNAIHNGEEYLNVSHEEPIIRLDTSSNDENLVFFGTATVQSYARLLQNISYNYYRMSSIIDNTPNLTPRIITVETVDINGQLSHPAQVTLVLDDTCSRTREGDTVTVVTMSDFEQLSDCRELELNLNIVPSDTTINSLHPISHIRSVKKLTINGANMLTNLEGLENLKSYTSLEIINNQRLITLQHLSSNYAPLGLTMRSVYVLSNRRIRDISGLQHITNVTGHCYVNYNSMLNDLSGLNNMLEVGNLAFLDIPLITDLNIANNLWKASSIFIMQMPALQSITGFQRLREIHTLFIQANTRLVHIDGFGGILSVHTVMIQSSPALCYILNETPDSNYWEGLGAQETTEITISSSCTQRNCSTNPCYNGGHCMMTNSSYSCMCTDGYYNGNNLQGCLFVNVCQTEPCLNGGICVLAELDLLGYRCSCPPGFTGTNCEVDIDDCISNPCINGGTCLDLVNDFSCICRDEFTGNYNLC